jgi:putative holliday junction resolvase
VPGPLANDTASATRGRVIGLDLGSVRIGVALSDTARTIAVPREVLIRSGDAPQDLRRVVALVAASEAAEVVVGLPVALDGTRGPAAAQVEAEAARLRDVISVPIILVDERLSSVEATRRRREARRPSRNSRRATLGSRHAPVDADAAAIILQSYLDKTKET